MRRYKPFVEEIGMHAIRKNSFVIILALGYTFSNAFGQSDSVSNALISNRSIVYESLGRLVREAKNNPRLKAADAKAKASFAFEKAQKSLDPPLVGVEFYQAPVSSFPNPVNGQMEYDYSIQQMFPFPGKLGTMAKTEQKRTEMLLSEKQTLEQDIIRTVKNGYFELYLLDRRIEINRETKNLFRNFVGIAKKQYEVGIGKQSDILRGQTELSSLDKDSIVLVQQRTSMQGMLNALCNRPLATEIEFIPEIYPLLPQYDLNALLALAMENRQELRSMQLGIQMKQAERAAAGKDYLPDFMVRGMYKQMTEGNDYWSLMLGVTVPVAPWSLNKYSSGAKRSDAEIQIAQSDFDNMKNMIAQDVNDALLKMESSTERLKLSRETAVPQARQSLESAMAAYGTGKQDFLMVIDIQRMLVMAKLDYHMAVMGILDSQSQLERSVGLSLNEIDRSIERGKQ